MIKTILATLAFVFLIATQAEAIDKSRAHPKGWNPNQGCGGAGGTRKCRYVCRGVGAFGRCVGSWVRQCDEWKCHRRSGELNQSTDFSSAASTTNRRYRGSRWYYFHGKVNSQARRTYRRSSAALATEFSSQYRGRYHDRRRSAYEERQKPFREAMLRKRRQLWLRDNLWAIKARNVGCPAGHVCRSKPTPYPF